MSGDKFTNSLSKELRARHIPLACFVVSQDNQIVTEIERALLFVIGSVPMWHGTSNFLLTTDICSLVKSKTGDIHSIT